MHNSKKWNIVLVFFVVVLLVLLAFLPSILAVNKVSNNMLTVVVDAGHGGIDGGVTGSTTFAKESELNLAISKKVAKELTLCNFNALLTRKTEEGLYEGNGKNLKQKDMQNRRKIILNSGADFVLSIHQNKYKDSSRRGVQVFYSDNGNKNTINFAHFMQNYLNKMINIPTQNRGYTAQNGDFYIVKCSTIPTIIIECGFLSNVEDEKMLVTEEYQTKLAKIIADGVSEFVSSKNMEKLESV